MLLNSTPGKRPERFRLDLALGTDLYDRGAHLLFEGLVDEDGVIP